MYQIFLDAFKELNVPIIWKWDEPMDDAPANVLIQKWVPQQDLLAHPNLKVVELQCMDDADLVVKTTLNLILS